MSDPLIQPGQIIVKDPLDFDVEDVRRRFENLADLSGRRIRNPHIETPVSEATVASAVDSSVLILITKESRPRVLLTKRQQGIRFPGHLCFPGGRRDSGESRLATAIREGHEEIGLEPTALEVLGSFGHYVTQAGYRIDPFVALVAPDYPFQPDAGEVASLHFFTLADVLDPAAYELRSFSAARAYFAFDQQGVHVGGPTVSLMIGLLEWLGDQ